VGGGSRTSGLSRPPVAVQCPAGERGRARSQPVARHRPWGGWREWPLTRADRPKARPRAQERHRTVDARCAHSHPRRCAQRRPLAQRKALLVPEPATGGWVPTRRSWFLRGNPPQGPPRRCSMRTLNACVHVPPINDGTGNPLWTCGKVAVTGRTSGQTLSLL